MSGEPGSSTAGVSTLDLSPERPRRYAPSSMLNDRSSLVSLLETRRSAKPRELAGPGPTAAEMERILSIAARTPDHGKLHPWRFVTVAH